MSKVKDFIEGSLLFYQDELQNIKFEDYDKQTIELYQAARREVQHWLTDVLIHEVEKYNYAEATCTLYLPQDEMTVTVKGIGVSKPEVFYTPVGKIDKVTYEAIIKDENPAKMLLDYIREICYLWNTHMSFETYGEELKIITEARLKTDNWRDPLKIHQFFPLAQDYEIFMSGKMLEVNIP